MECDWVSCALGVYEWSVIGSAVHWVSMSGV